MLPVIVLAISMQAVAQAPQGGTLNSQQGGSPSATNDKATSDNVNAEILEELERMRTRIQELESRLNRREADMKSSTKAELPVANQKLVGNQVLPSQGAEQQPAGAINEQTPRTKAEPFAFADWTWLNWNPRTFLPGGVGRLHPAVPEADRRPNNVLDRPLARSVLHDGRLRISGLH